MKKTPAAKDLPPPPPTLQELRVAHLKLQLQRLDEGIARETKTILENTFAQNLKEAYQVMDRFRSEEHIREQRDERHRLEFFNKRRAELEQELKEVESHG